MNLTFAEHRSGEWMTEIEPTEFKQNYILEKVLT